MLTRTGATTAAHSIGSDLYPDVIATQRMPARASLAIGNFGPKAGLHIFENYSRSFISHSAPNRIGGQGWRSCW